jgi:AcrR family transcriptional regulator
MIRNASSVYKGKPALRGKRDELVARIADTLLIAGVAQLPLRDLAVLIGTSDRMLLYYFDDKADLVTSSLQVVSTRFADLLATALPADTLSPVDMLTIAMPLFASVDVAPFMHVWADISARAGRGEEPFRAIANMMVQHWIGWLEQRLDLPVDERRETAVAILTVIEGARMIEGCLGGATDGVVAVVSRAFR